jgi:hypothetical protein
MAVLTGIPAGLLVMSSLVGTIPLFAVGVPLMIAIVAVKFARSVRKLPSRLFN